MPKPNVLFIAADDLCHVNRLLAVLVRNFDLPNLRRLSNRGTEFDRAYCVVPMCEPTRCAVMTGFSPADTKSFDLSIGWKQLVEPRNLWTYRLREAGYWMGTTGKIFHGYGAQPAEVYAQLYDSAPFTVTDWNPPAGEGTDMGGLYPLVFDDDTRWYDVERANDTINAIQNLLPTNRPWYWECGFHHPHNAWYTPRRIHEMINFDDVILPSDWQGGWDTLPYAREFVGNINLNTGNDPVSNDPSTWSAEVVEFVRRTIHNYAAGALWMDEQLGRVLNALDASPHAANTIITFYSDHGYHLSDHARFHKFTLYEQAALAPMVIAVPGQTPRKVTSPVSHVDLGATILQLCGLTVPTGFRGVSLKPWIDGQTPANRSIPTFWYGSASIAKGNKRVTVYQDGTSEMFNIQTDPWAKTNIAATDPEFAALREDCINASNDWGMLLVEEAIDTSRPSNLQSFLGTDVTDARFSTSFVALGDLNSKGRSPGHQRMYGNSSVLANQTVVNMPPHIEDFQLLGLKSGSVTLNANALNNRVNMAGVFFKQITINFGDGDDENVSPETTRIIAYGGAGNDILRAGSWGGNRLYGEGGNDTLYGNTSNDYLDGGAVDDVIYGGAGNDTILGGTGANVLRGDAGNDLIISEGQDTITGGADADTFRLLRCGLVRTITDMTAADTIDLAAWEPLQPVTVTQVGANVEITAGIEKVICLNVTRAVVAPRITGATVA